MSGGWGGGGGSVLSLDRLPCRACNVAAISHSHYLWPCLIMGKVKLLTFSF